jgi:hypothetical protein
VKLDVDLLSAASVVVSDSVVVVLVPFVAPVVTNVVVVELVKLEVEFASKPDVVVLFD